jgi:hypothetical protein
MRSSGFILGTLRFDWSLTSDEDDTSGGCDYWDVAVGFASMIASLAGIVYLLYVRRMAARILFFTPCLLLSSASLLLSFFNVIVFAAPQGSCMCYLRAFVINCLSLVELSGVAVFVHIAVNVPCRRAIKSSVAAVFIYSVGLTFFLELALFLWDGNFEDPRGSDGCEVGAENGSTNKLDVGVHTLLYAVCFGLLGWTIVTAAGVCCGNRGLRGRDDEEEIIVNRFHMKIAIFAVASVTCWIFPIIVQFYELWLLLVTASVPEENRSFTNLDKIENFTFRAQGLIYTCISVSLASSLQELETIFFDAVTVIN